VYNLHMSQEVNPQHMHQPVNPQMQQPMNSQMRHMTELDAGVAAPNHGAYELHSPND